MGVRGLTKRLRSYGIRTHIGDSHVVIDGPAMVYHVWSQQHETRLSVLDVPSYESLGAAITSWLNLLRRHGITIVRIFFDGYLPSSKQPVRIERLSKDLASWDTYYKEHPKRIPPPVFSTRNQGSSSSRPAVIPACPFLIPSAIEALLSHQGYRDLVRIIPGEADEYCASFASTFGHPCIILTSDSDLLAFRYRKKDTSIVFFSDVLQTKVDGELRLYATRFAPAAIETRLGISNYGGLCRLAFEMSEHGELSFNQLVHLILTHPANPKFAEFSQTYNIIDLDSPVHFPSKIVEKLYLLDPRVSEFLLRCSVSGSLTHDYDSPCVPMFLPILYDYPQRNSAWNAGQNIRKLAYALSAHAFNTGREKVVEYGRSSTGRCIDIPSTGLACQMGDELLQLLVSLGSDKTEDNPPVWQRLAVYLDCEMALSQDKLPLSVSLFKDVLVSDASPDPCSWELLHLKASFEAIYYSLRILGQVIQILPITACPIPNTLVELGRCTSSLPRLAELPLPEQFAKIICSWDAKFVLGKHYGLLEDHKAVAPPSTATNPARTLVQRKAAEDNMGFSRKPQAASRRYIHRNSFNLLDDNCSL